MQKLFMMVGLPASGKSIFARNVLSVNPGAVVHSSDVIRAEILGDENRQDRQDLVFQTLHERVLNDLANGKNVVYDATNISYKRRMAFLRRVNAIRLPNLQTICVFMATPYEDCMEQNKHRKRFVPESVIHKMYEKFDVPMKAEGWDEIWVMGNKSLPERLDSVSSKITTLMLRLSRLEHDNPHHEFTIGQHCMTTQQYLVSHYKDWDTCLLRAALLHDIGKEKTKVFYDTKGNPSEIVHYYHHERVGAYDSFCYTGDLSNDQRLIVALLIRWHMWPYVVEKSDNPNKTARRVRRLLGENIWKQIMVLNDCDRHAH